MFNLKLKKQTQQEQSTCEFINVADVRGNFLYTKDNFVYQYIKVLPMSTALMTMSEKEMLTNKMTKELSPIGVPFKMVFLSRPADVTQITNYYQDVKAVTNDQLKKDSLNNTIKFLSNATNSGSVLERQTFIALWIDKSKQNEEELYAKTMEFKNALNNCGAIANICSETEIINMIGLFYNPIFSKRIYDTTPNFTLLGGE